MPLHLFYRPLIPVNRLPITGSGLEELVNNKSLVHALALSGVARKER